MRQITEKYHVSPQITPDDVPALKEAGITTVICNRPDAENPPELQAEAMKAAVEAAGMSFEVLPLTHQTMTPDNVAHQAAMVEQSSGPVLAYCASGTRCTVVWSLWNASQGDMTPDQILDIAAKAGYDLAGLRPTLMAIAEGARG